MVGVGFAGGASSVDFKVFGKIAASWVASIPAAALGSIVLYMIFGLDETTFIISVAIILSIIIWLLYNAITTELKSNIASKAEG